MENVPEQYKHIKGWGIDADPKNDPTYPMRKRSNDTHGGLDWKRPTQQQDDTEILHSIERPNVTAVYGTSTPPRGLSGVIRRLAFKQSENEYGHWLPLILADRVDVVEGVLDDLLHGKVPNIFAEKGYPAEWKHNKTSLIAKMAVAGAITAGIVAMAVMNGKKSDNDRD